jgi:hypothetical protein
MKKHGGAIIAIVFIVLLIVVIYIVSKSQSATATNPYSVIGNNTAFNNLSALFGQAISPSNYGTSSLFESNLLSGNYGITNSNGVTTNPNASGGVLDLQNMPAGETIAQYLGY